MAMQDIIAKAKAVFNQAVEKFRSIRSGASEETEELIREVKTEETFVSVNLKETVKRCWKTTGEKIRTFVGKLSSRERLAILFVVGLAVGFGAKTVANDHSVIGYRDYTAKNANAYDLIALQKEVAENGGGEGFSGGGVAAGGACSQ